MIAYNYHKKHYPGNKCPVAIITTKLKFLSVTTT
jgi:hypothetical protein